MGECDRIKIPRRKPLTAEVGIFGVRARNWKETIWLPCDPRRPASRNSCSPSRTAPAWKWNSASPVETAVPFFQRETNMGLLGGATERVNSIKPRQPRRNWT